MLVLRKLLGREEVVTAAVMQDGRSIMSLGAFQDFWQVLRVLGSQSCEKSPGVPCFRGAPATQNHLKAEPNPGCSKDASVFSD